MCLLLHIDNYIFFNGRVVVKLAGASIGAIAQQCGVAPWAEKKERRCEGSCLPACTAWQTRSVDRSLLGHGYLADHAGLHVPGNRAGKINRAGLGELPNNTASLAGIEMDHVRCIVLHVGHAACHFRMRLQECGITEYHLVRSFTGVLDEKTDRFAGLDIDTGRGKAQVVIQGDFHGAIYLSGIAGLS